MSDFQIWLNQNREKFLTYTPIEVLDVAVACGFDKQEIVHCLSKGAF